MAQHTRGVKLVPICNRTRLVGLALGFSVLALLIITKEHDGGASITGGILGILVGVTFLIAACLHWKYCDPIQGRFQEGPSSQNRF